MILPDRWGPGSIFAYSGLDGEGTMENGVVGTLLGDAVGVLFHTPVKEELRFILKNVSDIEYEIVASDIVKLQLVEKDTGREKPLIFFFTAQDTLAGISTGNAAPVITCESGEAASERGSCSVHSCGGYHTALCKEENKGEIRFAVVFSRQSVEDAVEKAQAALRLDLEREAAEKLTFFTSVSANLWRINFTKSEDSSNLQERTLAKCFSVMKSQVYSPEGLLTTRWTTPDRIPHKKIWLWDSVFHSLGNRYISVDLACDTLRAVLCTQKSDGFIPIMDVPDGEHHIETQPPILAWGYYELYRFSGSKDILSESYNALKGYLAWNDKNRDSNRNHLYEWLISKDNPECRCGECGMDNSPRFDNPMDMDCIDFSCFMAKEAQCMAKIADVLGMNEESKSWNEKFEQIVKAVNGHLWDENDGFYYDSIISTGKLRKVKSAASFLPLFAGVCSRDRAERLVKHLQDKRSFGTPFPVPSVSQDDPTYGSDMWRGPVWINYNYMIIRGLEDYGYLKLADEIRRKTIEAVAFWYDHDGCVYEFYDSAGRISPSRFNRKGRNIQPYDIRIRVQCIRDYGWSCSLYTDLLLSPGRNTTN